MRKQLLAVVTAFCLLQSQTGNIVSAEAVEEIQPYSMYTDMFSTDIGIRDKRVMMSGMALGYDNVTKIEAKLVLQKHNGSGWVNIKTIEKTSKGILLTISGSAPADKYYNYRAKSTYTLYSGSKSEKVNGISVIVCY